MRQILAHRANDATFEKSKSDYASTAARHYNRKISSLLINEQHKRSGVQKFMDSNTNDSESSSKTKLPAAIDTTTATATAAKPTVDTDRLFATTRYTCEVIPKLWVNRVGCIKDALGNKQPYPAPTGEKNYDHLRRDAESRLAKIGIDAKSISDRFLLTSAGASFLPSTKRFL